MTIYDKVDNLMTRYPDNLIKESPLQSEQQSSHKGSKVKSDVEKPGMGKFVVEKSVVDKLKLQHHYST